MISEEKLQAIRDEAAEKYPFIVDDPNFYNPEVATFNLMQNRLRIAYIAGRTDEAEKNESNAAFKVCGFDCGCTSPEQCRFPYTSKFKNKLL